MRKLVSVTLVLAFLFLILLSGCSGAWKLEDPEPVVGNDPAIRITKVTWTQSGTEVKHFTVYGRAHNVDFTDYVACIFIHVPNQGWWPKPTWKKPFTKINQNGFWSNRVTTGGIDYKMDAVHVILVKKDTYRPPNGVGGYSYPPSVNPPLGIVASDEVEKPEKPTDGTDLVEVDGVIHEWVDGP